MQSAVSEHRPNAELNAHLRQLRLLRPGLQVHADDAHDARDFTAQGEMAEALRIVVLLEGAVDVAYGPRRIQLSSAGGPRPVARALMVSVNERDVFTRRVRQGGYARRVSLGVTREWLEQAGLAASMTSLRHFLSAHLSMHQWTASPRIAALAEQMVRPPDADPLLQNIYLEARALELVAEALAHAAGPQAPHPHLHEGLRPQEHRRMRELHDFVASPAADDLSLDAIARHAGTNPTTMQRQFRALFGTTIFDFMRESRLLRARQALERDGVTVAQAALLAGYTSPANFSTAYKRRFGIVPKLSRSRI